MILFNPQLGEKGIHTFPEGVSLKMNLIAWLEFELTTKLQSRTLTTMLQGFPSKNMYTAKWLV